MMEGSRRQAAETGGETAGGHAATRNTFKKQKDPNVHLGNAAHEERRHVKDQIIRGAKAFTQYRFSCWRRRS